MVVAFDDEQMLSSYRNSTLLKPIQLLRRTRLLALSLTLGMDAFEADDCASFEHTGGASRTVRGKPISPKPDNKIIQIRGVFALLMLLVKR